VADIADAELLLPLTKFLTTDSCAAANSTAVQTTEPLATILKKYHQEVPIARTLYYLCIEIQ